LSSNPLIAAACPAGVLAVARGVRLADGCMGCGRCVASCPSGALSARGYKIPDGIPEGYREIVVKCWKVPLRLLAEGTHAIPCLGGLSVASCWSAECQAGGSAQPPVAMRLEFVRSVEDDSATRILFEPLAVRVLPAMPPEAAQPARCGSTWPRLVIRPVPAL
jgi:ferredoxin